MTPFGTTDATHPKRLRGSYISDREVVRTLLETFDQVRETLGTGTGQSEESPRLMSAAWHEGSYQRLEDVLAEMRRDRTSRYRDLYAPSWLHWHVSERYLRCVRRTAYACTGCPESDRGRFSHLFYPPNGRKAPTGSTLQNGKPSGHRHRDPKRGKVVRFDARLVIDVQWNPGVRTELVEIGVDWVTAEMNRRGGAWLPREIRAVA